LFHHQDPDTQGRSHSQLVPGFVLDMTGVRQPGLLQLKAAPFRDESVTLIFEQPQLNRLTPVFMPGVDNTQGAANHGSKDNQY
jgi:hypothetical protein